jgi:hypothetical protein
LLSFFLQVYCKSIRSFARAFSAEPESYAPSIHEDQTETSSTVGPQSPGESAAGRARFMNYLPLGATGRNVLKCSTAYLIASLFTFSQPLAELIGMPLDVEGPVSNGHFIASMCLTSFNRSFVPKWIYMTAIAVYYNPAKDIGAMIEADLFL